MTAVAALAESSWVSNPLWAAAASTLPCKNEHVSTESDVRFPEARERAGVQSSSWIPDQKVEALLVPAA